MSILLLFFTLTAHATDVHTDGNGRIVGMSETRGNTTTYTDYDSGEMTRATTREERTTYYDSNGGISGYTEHQDDVDPNDY